MPKGTCHDKMQHFDTKFRPQSWTRTEIRCDKMVVVIEETDETCLFSKADIFLHVHAMD